MYMKRDIEALLRRAAKSFPAVLVTGPRQSGKTTLLKNVFPKADFVTFDDPVMQDYARTDPRGLIDRYGKKPVIFDEIQYVPELFSYLKMAIDNDRSRTGKWLLTGSQQFPMMHAVSDSLAGRIALITLLPFSHRELPSAGTDTIENIIWNGGYPELVLKPAIRDIWLPSYIRTYIERDVRHIVNVQNITLFQTFLSLCAARHAQELNIASIARDCGVAQPTIARWISLLQTSFIAYCLKPFHENLGKRLVKSPKLYCIDSALAAHLTRQGSAESLFNASMGGAFFEGVIVVETLKALLNSGKNGELYFWRSHDGMEIDLIVELSGTLHAFEIKKTQTPTARHADSLEKFIARAGARVGMAHVVCACDVERPLTRMVSALPWREYLKRLAKMVY